LRIEPISKWLWTLIGKGSISKRWHHQPATDGFWRRRIPATAQYKLAHLDAAGALFDLNYNVITSNSDPLTDVYVPASWNHRVGGTQWLDRLRFPIDFVLSDAGHNNTPNNPLCTVNKDTKQSQCFNSVARPEAGSPLYAYDPVVTVALVFRVAILLALHCKDSASNTRSVF
jgi:hypothetical protein